jgi:putative transposase
MSDFKRYYTDNNIVFITIVTYNRRPILLNNIETLRNAFKSVKYDYKIIADIILPDHLHLLIQAEKAEDFSKIIASFKANFSKNMPFNNEQNPKQIERREKGIWQRKYYDHIIRNENDFHRHIDYIHYNSIKHKNINPSDWKYSSFKKFVKKGYYEENWCNLEDKNNIINLDLE